MLAPLEEKNRCWRLRYADQEKFHLDSLPSLAEEEGVIISLRVRNVPEELARRAIAITDKRHPAYAKVTTAWLTSNPRGFARWLEARMGPRGRPGDSISSNGAFTRPSRTCHLRVEDAAAASHPAAQAAPRRNVCRQP